MDKKESHKKHSKYFSSYKPNDLFWGIGIENETYLEIPVREFISGKFFDNQKRERYSVNYYDTYLNGYFQKALETIVDKNREYLLPILVNSHELTKNDLSGQPMNNYDVGATPNIKFSGKTVFEYMKEQSKYFEEEYEKSYCFDGDTIEFMTQDFYKKNIKQVISELLFHKKNFLSNLNKLNLPLARGLHFKYAEKNFGFARFTTNRKNLAIFNNSTYHFNFTMPTQLDELGYIKNFTDFERKHIMAIRLIQILEPFFVAKFGSGDILSTSSTYKKRFPSGSQRAAASRYISIGTFDTKNLKHGKILQDDRIKHEKKWYTDLYKQIHYKKNDKIGFDINFNKFKNHGIEIRFFDYFPEIYLEEVLTNIVYLLDHSLSLYYIDSYIDDFHYNNIVYKAILEGKDAILNKLEVNWLIKVLKIRLKFKSYKIVDMYDVIFSYLKKRYDTSGQCSSVMLEKKLTKCFSF